MRLLIYFNSLFQSSFKLPVSILVILLSCLLKKTISLQSSKISPNKTSNLGSLETGKALSLNGAVKRSFNWMYC